MAGSSAAETAMPNRLTGSILRVWALVSPVTGPSPKRLARTVSTKPEICTTPRLRNTGPKLAHTSRTWPDRVSKCTRKQRASFSTKGN